VLRDLPRRSLAPNQEANPEKISLSKNNYIYHLQEDAITTLTNQTLIALRKSNAPEREGPPPKDFVVGEKIVKINSELQRLLSGSCRLWGAGVAGAVNEKLEFSQSERTSETSRFLHFYFIITFSSTHRTWHKNSTGSIKKWELYKN
jgi:hypothetical protein